MLVSGAPGDLQELAIHVILKRKVAIGTTVLAAMAFAGGAYAATQASGPSAQQVFLNDVAKRLNVSPSQLSSALQGAFKDQLQAAVAAGRITQAQANAIEGRQQRSGSAALGAPPAFGAPRARLFGGPAVGALAAAGSYLGVTRAQLLEQLSAGKSLAQVAAAHGKSVSGLTNAITAATRARLDKLVAAKMITSAQEQKLLARLSSALDSEINHTGLVPRRFGAGGPPWFGPRRAGIGFGPRRAGMAMRPNVPAVPGALTGPAPPTPPVASAY